MAVADAPAERDALWELTPQQRQIVRLASDGLTNREIGDRLFLSPRTVSSHLYRSYPKLGVSRPPPATRRDRPRQPVKAGGRLTISPHNTARPEPASSATTATESSSSAARPAFMRSVYASRVGRAFIISPEKGARQMVWLAEGVHGTTYLLSGAVTTDGLARREDASSPRRGKEGWRRWPGRAAR